MTTSSILGHLEWKIICHFKGGYAYSERTKLFSSLWLIQGATYVHLLFLPTGATFIQGGMSIPHTAGSDNIFVQIYMDALPGVPWVS